MLYAYYEVVVAPSGKVHRTYDNDNYTFCGTEFPLERGWKRPKEDEQVRVTCKRCALGKAGY